MITVGGKLTKGNCIAKEVSTFNRPLKRTSNKLYNRASNSPYVLHHGKRNRGVHPISQRLCDPTEQTAQSNITASSPNGSTSVSSQPTIGSSSQAETIHAIYICYHTRNVTLRSTLIAKPAVNGEHTDIAFKWSSACPPPSILSTCKESREERLRHYQLKFGNVFFLGHGVEVTSPPRTYINSFTDRICPLKEFPDIGGDKGLNKYCLKNIAVNSNESWAEGGWKLDDSPFRMLYPECWFDSNIREIILCDEDFSERDPHSLEFESNLQLLDDLNTFMENFDPAEDLRMVRALETEYMAEKGDGGVPYELRWEERHWTRPLVKVVRVRKEMNRA
ncbi:uncharacterized protein RAG0_09854 [Rhynchosporium agropyri]|uniref:2EXR domain-containing protein n=1 Tax=Rhynchosporium agropyri TaxID=914238 RepID=A0A1E1KXB4_9HELO|nr:uncharacterized protein RAG0_09854 [Rhynchosporium agropyri]